MAKSVNTFLKSKMNQDLDSRIIPKGEYRTGRNIQVSASESENAGSVENILGNINVLDIEDLTGVSDSFCIGYCVSDETSSVYLFWTNWFDTPNNNYSPSADNFIIRYNSQTQTSNVLVRGAFLNFSRQNPIHGSNVLENLLFWTDNRNQPRVINLEKAEADINYYTTEDQISVSKYNPYDCIELFEESYLSSQDGAHECTLKDVVSKSYPNGGFGNLNSPIAVGATSVDVNSFTGDIVLASSEYPTAATVGYTAFDTGQITVIPGATLLSATYNEPTSIWTFTITGGSFPQLTTLSSIVLNPNPYYNAGFAGDPDFLEDKFSRFSYRFKYEDNEYSVFAPFTQVAFIPEQDGYFLYVKKPDLAEVQDQSDTYRSTTVSFMQNKVNDIKLRIPLPFKNYNIQNSLKLKEIDILYKESDSTAVKVIETVTINNVEQSAGTFSVIGPIPNQVTFNIDSILGGVPIGGLVTGFGIVGKPKITNFDPDDPNNPSSGGEITLDIAQTLIDNVVLNINNPNYFVFNYQSKKPFKTLPEADLIRVYDKVPVKALAQEVSGNRVIYGNFQNKHTPPKFLNYNVSVSAKADFDLKKEEGTIIGGPYNGTTIEIQKGATPPNVGDFISIVVGTGSIPEETQVVSVTENPVGSGNYLVVLTNAVTGLVATTIVLFEPGSDTSQTTSIIEYPNHSVKSNRNYQVGIVLSDRYGRTSTVVLSDNKDTILVGSPPVAFSGSTIYSPYIDPSIIPSQWPGNSLKLLFNQTIDSTFNAKTGTPGLYNGDPTSSNYNPLGWYSYKVVVKQTEQEYYNVYLPGIMASYPSNSTLELGSTSHVVLINDNINKVPRDLNEVGPEQRQFRSSVKLFGRVENTSNLIDPTTDLGSSNKQYYPKRFNDIVSTISTVRDLFDYTAIGEKAPRPDYFPQFYDLDSNPLIARVSTHSKIGQTSTTNYDTVSAQSSLSTNTDIIRLASIAGDTNTINPGDKVLGSGFPDDLIIETPGFTAESPILNTPAFATVAPSINNILEINTVGNPAQSIAIGDLVSSSVPDAIPAGTFITDIDTTTPATPKITLSNDVGISGGITIVISNPARIKVNKPVSVTSDQTVTIVNDSTPGVQYLAVYETDPQESLLDIFWETSTSGLVSDLNNAVIDSNSGGASLSGLNPSPFTEGLEEGGEIFAAPFSMLNNFGQIIPFSEIDETLEILSVTNNVPQTLNPPYFQLTQVPGSNLFNIVTTSAYFDAIFFNYSPDTIVFNFKFRAVINGLETFFEEEVALQNVSPSILAPTQGQTFSITPSTEGVTNVSAVNGSANDSGFPTPALSGIFTAGDCTIISQTSGSIDGPTVNYFAITPTNVSGTAEQASWLLSNTAVNTIPVETYYLTIQVQDAGGVSFADTVDIIISLGVTVTDVYQKIVQTSENSLPENSPNYNPNFYNTGTPSQSYQFLTYFRVSSGPLESQGWYIYNGAFSSSSYHYFYTYFSGIANSPVGYSNTWQTTGSYLTLDLADENNVIQIDYFNSNGDITQLKQGGTELAAFDQWFNGGVNGSISCRYSQVWPFPSGIPYNPSTDATPTECNFNPLGAPANCVPGMTERVSPYADSSLQVLSGPGGVLEISANAEEFGLDQFTWAIVT